MEHTAILAAVPLEEYLVGTEDAADAIHGHVPVLQDVQVVVPELVLDEERHHGTDSPQEAARIGNRVERQVADDVGSLVVLAHLVAAGREERQQDFILRVVASQLFHEWSSLLKLTQ